jgi:hypothetical protein
VSPSDGIGRARRRLGRRRDLLLLRGVLAGAPLRRRVRGRRTRARTTPVSDGAGAPRRALRFDARVAHQREPRRGNYGANACHELHGLRHEVGRAVLARLAEAGQVAEPRAALLEEHRPAPQGARRGCLTPPAPPHERPRRSSIRRPKTTSHGPALAPAFGPRRPSGGLAGPGSDGRPAARPPRYRACFAYALPRHGRCQSRALRARAS